MLEKKDELENLRFIVTTHRDDGRAADINDKQCAAILSNIIFEVIKIR